MSTCQQDLASIKANTAETNRLLKLLIKAITGESV